MERSHKADSHFGSSTSDKNYQTLEKAWLQIHAHTPMHTHKNVHTSALLHHGCCALSNNIRLQRSVSGIIRITHPLHSSLCVSSSLTGWASSLTPSLPPAPHTHDTQTYNSTLPNKWWAFLGKSCSPLVMALRIGLFVWTFITYFYHTNVSGIAKDEGSSDTQSWGMVSQFQKEGVSEAIMVGDENGSDVSSAFREISDSNSVCRHVPTHRCKYIVKKEATKHISILPEGCRSTATLQTWQTMISGKNNKDCAAWNKRAYWSVGSQRNTNGLANSHECPHAHLWLMNN